MPIHKFNQRPGSDEPSDDPQIPPSGMGAPPVSHGGEIPPVLPDDDLDEERMAEQGVDDAETDSMREARREQDRKDS